MVGSYRKEHCSILKLLFFIQNVDGLNQSKLIALDSLQSRIDNQYAAAISGVSGVAALTGMVGSYSLTFLCDRCTLVAI